VSASPLTPVQSYEFPSEAPSNEEFTPSTISTQDQEPLVTDEAEAQAPVQGEDGYDIVRSSERAESFHSSSTDSLGEPLQPGIPSTFLPLRNRGGSLTSSQPLILIYQIPLQKCMKQVLLHLRAFESFLCAGVSSLLDNLGFVSHNPMASGPSSSTPSSGGLSHLAQWQINAIS
jgi:GDP/GTP exchange factor required for growth at low temperature